MPIDLTQTNPQRLAGGATVVVSVAPGAKPEPGRTVAQTWRIDVSPPGKAGDLTGEVIQARIALPAQQNLVFFQGDNVAAPMPDAAWDELSSTLSGGVLSARLAKVQASPLYAVLGR